MILNHNITSKAKFHNEGNYLELLNHILTYGIEQDNRTGIPTLTVPGAMLKLDLDQDSPTGGFPALTTKKLAFNQVKGELIAFLEGTSSLARFKELGCDVWDANVASPAWQSNPNCNGPDDMGNIYGIQWRNYLGGSRAGFPIPVDQIQVALDLLRNNPTSRRILVNAWNPAELNQACLPPCHVLFQLLPHISTKTLHMTMYMRSCDMFLGVPFNMASYGILLHLFALWSGFKPGTLTMFLADAHIYTNHIDQVKEQLSRVPFEPPQLICFSNYDKDPELLSADKLISSLEPKNIQLINYMHHPAIKAPMAV